MARLIIPASQISEVLETGHQIRAEVLQGLPKGARLVRAAFHGVHAELNDLELVFEHETFDPLGTWPPPILPLSFGRLSEDR